MIIHEGRFHHNLVYQTMKLTPTGRTHTEAVRASVDKEASIHQP